jgi:hypothetical protein
MDYGKITVATNIRNLGPKIRLLNRTNGWVHGLAKDTAFEMKSKDLYTSTMLEWKCSVLWTAQAERELFVLEIYWLLKEKVHKREYSPHTR